MAFQTPSLTQSTIQSNKFVSPTAVSDYTAAFNNYVYAAPQGVGQIDSFTFDYQLSNEVRMDNEITDHWLEDFTAVQDHIGVKPKIVILRGYVAELVFKVSFFEQLFAGVQNALSQVPAYLGSYTAGTTLALTKAITQAQNIEQQAVQAFNRAAGIVNLVSLATGAQTKQQKAFAQLSALRDAKILFTVFTPFQVYTSMAITQLTATQREKSKDYSEFSVTMKQVNITGATTANSSTAAGKFLSQIQKTASGVITTVSNAQTLTQNIPIIGAQTVL